MAADIKHPNEFTRHWIEKFLADNKHPMSITAWSGGYTLWREEFGENVATHRVEWDDKQEHFTLTGRGKRNQFWPLATNKKLQALLPLLWGEQTL